ncbi:hypothetical protein JTB14_030300 [Gonioctena quinquepunctata]|nr:hypothetical protein JTB14_030300 [Gonioctena quinquepunctata]
MHLLYPDIRKDEEKRVCSRHFITGKPASLEDETNPDWVPSQNMRHSSANFRNNCGAVEKKPRLDKRKIKLTESIMPTWCSVTSCGNRSDKTSDVSYHKFPKNDKERKLWILMCGKGLEWVPSQTARICSSHFTKLDFERNLRYELIGGIPRKNLKKGVIPSIINDDQEKPMEIEFDKYQDNQNITKDIDRAEKKAVVTEIIEIQVPRSSYHIWTSYRQSSEGVNLDYENLYPILVKENYDLKLKNSKLSNEKQRAQRKLRAIEKRLCNEKQRAQNKLRAMEKRLCFYKSKLLKKQMIENK